MNITIHGQNIKVTEGIEEFAREKLERLERYLPSIADLRMELTKEHTRRGDDVTIAQITLRHERGAILRAEEKIAGNGRDAVMAAIGAAVDKMYTRIHRFKGKRDPRKKDAKEQFFATLEELKTAEELPEEVIVDDPEFEAEVVRRKQVPVTMMTEQEAINQMELLGHAFFMFQDATTGKISVLYRRSTGDYGILEPNAM